MFDDSDRRLTVKPTDAPPVGPTVVPPFNIEGLARDLGRGGPASPLSEAVLEVVSDVSWSEAKLDLVEIEVIHAIDGIAPVMLLESILPVSRDELHAILVTLIARGVLRIVAYPATGEPPSGIYRKLDELELDEDVAKAG